MTLIKKLDLFILKKFLLVFAASFCITLFVFMMQFTWRYVDELIGKGLTLDILAQFYWYMGITLMPQSLPLAVLLASLITFGNMAEQLELLAMKAAGVPLSRIMQPILIVVLLLTGTSFYFQNKAAPEAQISMRQLLISMKQTSPVLEIPEGQFYNGIPNVNVYVQQKVPETGMLYDVTIYKTDRGFDRAQIVLADSGRLEMSADKLHLFLELWQGEQYESLQGQNALGLQQSAKNPFDHESFDYKKFIIDFDANFSLMDAEALRNMAETKNMQQIEESVDSMNLVMDSLGTTYYDNMRRAYLRNPEVLRRDSAKLLAAIEHVVHFDSLLAKETHRKVSNAIQGARNSVQSYIFDLDWKAKTIEQNEGLVRRHWLEWHKKMALALSCLLFFFIGAPLGAIIGKGGLGMPAIVSVLIFIAYFIVDTATFKMARDGSIAIWLGTWVSPIVLLPCGAYLTIMANRDSVVFNKDAYVLFFRRLFGIRTKRNLWKKEVVIYDPDYESLYTEVVRLSEEFQFYRERKKLYRAPNYKHIFFRRRVDHTMEDLNERLEAVVEQLSNSRNQQILREINKLPQIYVYAHTHPFARKRYNILVGVCLPVGLLMWLRIWRFRLRLMKDIKQIVKRMNRLHGLIGQELQRSNPEFLRNAETNDNLTNP
ncbi:MAG: LptF/LptG family permease [Bacteroidaceae bacterium]|nr:LptF/LptG family permease [Bacteroidaceae bacterium]